ncbi:MAG: hypothetical protein H0Z40_06520 [Desulfotomaculum sp.]|nr:hypothetical protein [Desulfotomaculum sp.]
MHRMLIVFLSLLMFFFISTGYVEAGQAGSVIVVVIDNININDLVDNNLENFSKLMKEGAAGLLNTNTEGRINAPNTHITIGAGAHALGSSLANMAYPADKILEEGTAAEIYQQRTGRKAPEGSIVQLGIPRLNQVNKTLSRSVQVGAVGTALHQEGFKTAVFGNSDITDKPGRLAVCIAMDKHGIVDYGSIGPEILVKDPNFPGGKRTNYSLLLKEVVKSLPNYQLIVVDLGDISRLEKQSHNLYSDIYQENYRLTLKRVDNFLGSLVREMGEKDLLMVVSPTPRDAMLDENKKLTPIIIWGSGFKHDGSMGRVLISGTTKHPGIVMNTDIAPTILSHLGIESSHYISGRPMYSTKISGNAAEFLSQKQHRLAVTYSARPPLQEGYVLVQIIVLAVSLWLIFVAKKGLKLLEPAMLAVVSVPLSYLLLPMLPQPSVAVVALELIIVTFLLTAAAILLGRGNFMNSFGLLAGITSFAIVLDILLGQPMQKQAVLSYDPMVGARFYGIGNEYMGVLIGATIMFTALILNKYPRYRKILTAAAGIYFSITIYCMGAPHLGTNVGGTIAAAASFLLSLLLFTGLNLRPKAIGFIALAVVLLLLGFIFYDVSRPIQQQSHIGKTASLILNGGAIEIVHIINRKLGMNLKLLRYTVWSKVLLASIITLAILFYKPRGVMKDIQNKYPYLFKGFVGVVTGALLAFAFNDSGVVAAATTMIFGAPPLIVMVLNEQIR